MVKFILLERLVINHMHNAVDLATRVLTKMKCLKVPKVVIFVKQRKDPSEEHES